MFGTSILLFAASALLADTAQAAWLREGRVPVPVSEGHKKFGRFLKTCFKVRLGKNMTNIPEPKSIFSKVPGEWLAAQNQTLAAAAKKYEGNFQSISGNDALAFYNDLCPYIETPPPELMARMKTIHATCKDVKANTLSNLPAPNTVWDPASQYFQHMLTPHSHGNHSHSHNGTNSTDHHDDGWHHFKHMLRKDTKVLFHVLANMTGTNYADEMWNRGSHDSRVAFKKGLLDRLGQAWNDGDKTDFWKKYCSLKKRHYKKHKHGHHTKNKDGKKVDANGNVISGAEMVSVSGASKTAIALLAVSLASSMFF